MVGKITFSHTTLRMVIMVNFCGNHISLLHLACVGEIFVECRKKFCQLFSDHKSVIQECNRQSMKNACNIPACVGRLQYKINVI